MPWLSAIWNGGMPCRICISRMPAIDTWPPLSAQIFHGRESVGSRRIAQVAVADLGDVVVLPAHAVHQRDVVERRKAGGQSRRRGSSAPPTLWLLMKAPNSRPSCQPVMPV